MAAVQVSSDGGELPRRFGRYVLFDKIGEGGMARIFLSRENVGLGGEKLIVVKEILPLLATSPEFCQLLIDEAKISATLSHANIVQVTDLGREGNTLYIAMEYVEGLDLRDLLKGCSKKKIPLPVEFALFVVMETLRALDYAHRKTDESGRPLGIVHRDVSPSNVLLSVEGEVKLCDFGIARAITTDDVLPDEAIQGKAGYMSPEAARGGTVDFRSDLFSLGIILYEMLSGRRLYRISKEVPELLECARRAEIADLPSRGHPDEERLYGIVMRALAVDVDARYQTAQDMLRDLQEYVAGNGLVVSQLRFGEWILEHFAGEIIERRSERERAAKRLEALGDGAEREPPAASRPALPPPLPPAPLPPSEPAVQPPPAPAPVVTRAPIPAVPPSKGGSGVTVLWVVLAAAIGGLVAWFVFR